MEDRLTDLEMKLSNEQYQLDRTSNPMKMRRRKRDIKELKLLIEQEKERLKTPPHESK